jgi:DNA-binding transcriptional LysR family regulator
LGVAVVSATTVAKEVRLGELTAVPLHPPLRRQLSLVYPPEKFRSKLLQAFLDFIEAHSLVQDITHDRV